MKRAFLLVFIIVFGLALTACPVLLVSKIGQDLVISLGRFDPTARTSLRGAQGGVLRIPVRISDQSGAEITGTYTVSFTLSADADLATTADNTSLGTVDVTAGQTTTIELSIDAATALAFYTLFASLPTGADAVTNNNTASIQVEIGANAPDLVVTSFTAPAARDPEGGSPGTYEIANQGYAPVAAGTSIVVRFSVFLSGTWVEKGTTTISLSEALEPFETVSGTVSTTMPTASELATDEGVAVADLNTWTGNVRVQVDPDNSIAESDDTNNTSTVAKTVYASKEPDLQIGTIEIFYPAGNKIVKIGGAVQASVEVYNSGTASASGYQVEMFVDIDGSGTRTTGDLTLYTWTAPDSVPYDPNSIGAKSANNTLRLAVPADAATYPSSAAGTFDVVVQISGSMTEYDSTNNAGTVANVEFRDSIVDLSMYRMGSTLSASVDEAAGGQVPLTFVIENSGTDAVDTDFQVHFYASVNNGLNPAGDVDLGSTTVTDSIPAGRRRSLSFNATFPAGQGAGFYTVFWVIDDTSAVAETDEGNNTIATANGNADVFVPVADGTSNLPVRLLLYNPENSPSDDLQMRFVTYTAAWSGRDTIFATGTNIDAGDLADSEAVSPDLVPGTNGLLVEPFGLDEYPYAFRFVPDYVTSLPANTVVPTALPPAPDGFEPNDTQTSARSSRPLFEFVNAYLEDGADDYYTFTY